MTPWQDHLFVLELANNHLGSAERGLRIVREFSAVVRTHQVHAAIKLQLRRQNFVHKDFTSRQDIRYVKKTIDTRMPDHDFIALARAIRNEGRLLGATAFDEDSVQFSQDLGVDFLKIASSDVQDSFLLSAISKTHLPVIASTAGAPWGVVDDLVAKFPTLALNHCVACYPSEDHELELDRIDQMRLRYPRHSIGFSTHEHTDWTSSMLLSYAKGARLWERHIDIDDGKTAVSPYCSLPHQVGEWFVAFHKAREMCGGKRREAKEREYLNSLRRGVYAARDLPAGHILGREDVYFAIPCTGASTSDVQMGIPLEKSLKQHDPIQLPRGGTAENGDSNSAKPRRYTMDEVVTVTLDAITRERCARIAESFGHGTGAAIAKRIRRGM